MTSAAVYYLLAVIIRVVMQYYTEITHITVVKIIKFPQKLLYLLLILVQHTRQIGIQ
jgi:hypothetical protein